MYMLLAFHKTLANTIYITNYHSSWHSWKGDLLTRSGVSESFSFTLITYRGYACAATIKRHSNTGIAESQSNFEMYLINRTVSFVSVTHILWRESAHETVDSTSPAQIRLQSLPTELSRLGAVDLAIRCLTLTTAVQASYKYNATDRTRTQTWPKTLSGNFLKVYWCIVLS